MAFAVEAIAAGEAAIEIGVAEVERAEVDLDFAACAGPVLGIKTQPAARRRQRAHRLGEAKVLDRKQHPRMLRVKLVIAWFRPRRQRQQQGRNHGPCRSAPGQIGKQAAMARWRNHQRTAAPGRSTDHSACARVIAR
jgi:hypothetical protein